ncbi:pyrroline-5-carboxylate reductase [Virgibacillus natechei]|uniref:Pyrroline-5-carboxylate reductase n=1 Tax=Virgibacillus natechei TaxID=1216297 RepID=A0ABS4IJJ8_9BACI|nr:pyrroline-5-carboxylate reductase [Virgibacillus natechei]MBP1971085.1 pyrroline-5-carboxylate reductase [Virgibacillus natechei]UZD13027.1 pyrroline-5-carboxylate reductase [Virgibacillus natechei]
MNKNIAFIGAGSMAEAIISGVVKAEILNKEQIIVTNKNNRERVEQLQQKYDIRSIMDKEKVAHETDIIILATKPYDLQKAVESIKPYIRPNHLLISVIAGVSTDYISNLFGGNTPVVRTMPNTSASIGYSATAISAGKYATNEHLEQAETLFNTIGTTTIVDENDMHTVTGISGSGPAYIYYLVEAMEKAAVEAGLDQEVARTLVTQTVVGAGEMLQHSGESASTLRDKITSPAGTTAAGIEALDQHHFEETIRQCVKSARDRSIELGENE